MKRILLLTTLLALLGSLPAAAARSRSIKGSGVLRTETRDTKPFTGLKVARGIAATLTDDPAGKLVVEADEKIIDYVRTTVDDDGVLRLTIDDDVRSISNCTVRIGVPTPAALRSLKASSGAMTTCQRVVKAPKLDVKASSGACVEIAFEGDGCTLEASSGSRIKANLAVGRCAVDAGSGAAVDAKGTAGECRIHTSSGAACNARNLLTRIAEARASSGASIRISCSEKLDAAASSGGSVAYWGDCRLVNYKKSLTGSVTHKR